MLIEDFEDRHTPRLRRVEKIFHTCIPIRESVPPYGTWFSISPDFHFRAKYLIVLTSGFTLSLRCMNTGILHMVDGDTYYRANWDRLERFGELDRVRLDCPTVSPANKFIFDITPTLKATRDQWFRASLIGVGLSYT